VQRGFARFVLGRAIQGVLFVLIVSSSSLLLAQLAPGDHLAEIGADPRIVAAERHRLGLDRPLLVQYGSWLASAVRLDFGTSLKYQRPVSALVGERAINTVILGGCALALATAMGLIVGTLAGAGRGGVAMRIARGLSVVLLSVPPLVTSFTLLLAAAITGWLPVGGFPLGSGSPIRALAQDSRYLILPTLALALPLGASLERLQASAVRVALAEPSLLAAKARGVGPHRILWRHALRLSLGSILSIYGIVVATALSGSFAVEVVVSWPGLGALMYEALVARDLFLVAGCAVAVSSFLAVGVFASDLALAAVDPRRGGPP
jgi:peptide/nickel transport system permease protein